MKATEVMPLDWLEFKDFKAVQISGSAIYTDEDTTNSISFDDLEYNESAFKPIPLTEDILKVNGFERNVLCAGDYYFAPAPDMHDVLFKVAEDNYEDVWHVESIVDHNDNAYALFNVCYVHEMQHILRICGLTDLADNFKLA